MTGRILFVFLICAYLALIAPFASHMQNRPLALKLGYMPEAEVIKMAVGDQRYLIAQWAVVRVLFYYGDMTERLQKRVKLKPEYFNMFKTLQTAVKLDPYNMDAYYFTQAAFTWELRRIKEVNDLLDYGIEHRTWDPYLPFFAGFNAAYFLKDYTTAANYMKRASEISQEPLYANLTARYFYESGQNDLGIIFLSSMEKEAKDPKIRKLYEFRKQALVAVRDLSQAVRQFLGSRNRLPYELEELVSAGFMKQLPVDPYGGKFYLDEKGVVRSTSKFSFGGEGR